MRRTESTLSSIVIVAAFVGTLVYPVLNVSAGLSGADYVAAYFHQLAYLFFIEPYYSALDGAGAAAGPLQHAAVLFVLWLAIAALVARARQQNHRYRMAFLVLFPALAIYAFNILFDAGAQAPSVEPAAVVALIGSIIYEIYYAGKWSRVCLTIITFGLCSAYALHTALGFWGAIAASGTMAIVQLVWSGIELNLFNSTYVLHDRKFQCR